MQPLLRDIFSETVTKIRQLGMWDKMTARQIESLVSKNILEYYNKKQNQQKAAGCSNSR